MNIIDVYLDKVGKQLYLTRKAMQDGKLTEEEAKLLTELQENDLPLDKKLAFTIMDIFRSGQTRYISGTNEHAKLARSIERLAKIYAQYDTPSVYNDLKTLAELNEAILSIEEEGNLTPKQILGLIHGIYFEHVRYTIYPTHPLAPRSTIAVLLDDEEFNHERGQIIYSLKEVMEMDQDAWNKKFPNFPADKDGELMKAFVSLLDAESFTDLIKTASELFNPIIILSLAEKSFTPEGIKGLDGVRDELMEYINTKVTCRGFLDYRLTIISLFFTQLRFSLEENN